MKKSKSFKLFLLSATIIVLTFLVATFWDALSLGSNKILLAVSIMISFGISIAGLIYGFDELKQARFVKIKTGLVGNFLVILFFAFIIIYSFYIKK